MAQYRYVSAEICRVPEGKQNAGKEFIRAKIKNVKAFYEEAQTFMCFQDDIVAALKPYISINKNGTAQEDKPIPAEFNVTGCWCDFIPGFPFYKKHLSHHAAVVANPQAPKGKPEIKIGDLVKDDDGWGNPILFTKLRVFCQYYIDDDGSKVWLKGCAPDEMGQQAFAAYCVSTTQNNAPQTVEPTEVITYQAQQPTTQQPQTAQPQAQFAQQPGQGQPAQPQAQHQFIQQPNVAQF